MGNITVLGANLLRVEEDVAQALLRLGLIYVGDDNQLHVTEQKNISTQTAKSE